MGLTNYNRFEVAKAISTLNKIFENNVNWLPTAKGFMGSFGDEDSPVYFRFYNTERVLVFDISPVCNIPEGITNSSPNIIVLGLDGAQELQELYGKIISELAPENVLSVAIETILDHIETVTGIEITHITEGEGTYLCATDQTDLSVEVSCEAGQVIATFNFLGASDMQAVERLSAMIGGDIVEVIDEVKYTTV